MSAGDRASLRSSIKGLCALHGKVPEEVPADPTVVRALVETAPWPRHKTKRRWANMRSAIARAMKIAGIDMVRPRSSAKPSPEWESLIVGAPGPKASQLRRFARWCTALQLSPPQVTREVFLQYLEHLETMTVLGAPLATWNAARYAWNNGVADVPGSTFPHIASRTPRAWRALPESAFPVALQREIVAWNAALTTASPLDEGALEPVKTITVKNYRNQFRYYLSHLVEDGVDIGSLDSLAACITPSLAKRGLERALGDKEFNEVIAPSLAQMLKPVLSIAKYLRVSSSDLDELQRLNKTIRRKIEPGMAPRNLARLRELSDPEVLRLLYRLPFETADRLRAVSAPNTDQAFDMQMAVLLAMLSRLPLRIKNMAELDLDKHFTRPALGKPGLWRVHIDKFSVKNKFDVSGEFNQRVSSLLDLYCSVFRPVLLKRPSSRLFVSRNGSGKAAQFLGAQFRHFLWRTLRLRVHPHLMRHLTARVFLDANPGQYERVRQLLGHKSVSTTVAYYAGEDQEGAIRVLDEIIDRQVDDSPLNIKVRKAKLK